METPIEPNQSQSSSQRHLKAASAVDRVEAAMQAPRLQSKQLFLLLAETFQALGDSSRVQIVWAISHGELCVGDIAKVLNMSQPSVSHHLRTLRNLKLVKTRKEGRTVYYSLDDHHIETLLREGIEHVEDFL